MPAYAVKLVLGALCGGRMADHPDILDNDGLDGVNILALRRNSTTEFEGLYDAGSGLVSLGTYDVGTEPALGAAFGYVMGNGRKSGLITAQVDNLRMDVIPEPTTLALLALGGVALLRRPRRR